MFTKLLMMSDPIKKFCLLVSNNHAGRDHRILLLKRCVRLQASCVVSQLKQQLLASLETLDPCM